MLLSVSGVDTQTVPQMSCECGHVLSGYRTQSRPLILDKWAARSAAFCCCRCCCFCFWPSPRNCWTPARASRLGRRERLALMRVRGSRSCAGWAALYGLCFLWWRGLCARRARGGAGLLFARNRCDGGSEPCDAIAALAGRRELERSGSRRPEERSDGGLAPGGQRRRGTARAILRGVERSGTEHRRAHAGRDAASPTGAKRREHRV